MKRTSAHIGALDESSGRRPIERSTLEGLQEVIEYRANRLERENEYLRAERTRLEALLADALRVAVAGTGVSPLALFEQLAVLHGTNLARPAFVEHRERLRAEAIIDRAIRVLQETS